MSAAERPKLLLPPPRSFQTGVIPYEHPQPEPHMPDTNLPDKPATEIRYTGLLGLRENTQDVRHDSRLSKIRYLGVEVAYAEKMTISVEVKGIQSYGEGMKKAEEIVKTHPSDTVAGMLTADLAGDMASRAPSNHRRMMDLLDAENMNILGRR